MKGHAADMRNAKKKTFPALAALVVVRDVVLQSGFLL
jgi:hypothetical protein